MLLNPPPPPPPPCSPSSFQFYTPHRHTGSVKNLTCNSIMPDRNYLSRITSLQTSAWPPTSLGRVPQIPSTLFKSCEVPPGTHLFNASSLWTSDYHDNK